MLDSSAKTASRSISFLKENPQILYTAFLLIIIPAAFLVSGQQFLRATSQNQERLEKERIGLMQDVFASMLRTGGYFDVPVPETIDAGDSFLQNVINDIRSQNEPLSAFRVVVRNGGANTIIASLNSDEVGKEDIENRALYQTAGLSASESFIFETYEEGMRHWKAVRALTDAAGEIRGFSYADVSMARIDESAARSVRNAYYILVGIIFVIVLLLARQAKVVDYAVLYRRLKEVDQMKDDFVSMAAHELRTPLAVIKGYVSMISPERLTDSDKEGLSRISISVENLNNLVGDILDVVRIDQGRMRFDMKEIDASDSIADAVDSLQSLAKEKHLTLAFDNKRSPDLRHSGEDRDFAVHITADPVRLTQALINIIGNAIKYTPKGSVSVMMTEENGRVSIRVRDTGIGISAEDQKRLFTKFFRIRSKETEDIRGTGLGLWITMQIISGMNGVISVESIKGKGSDFILSFPVVSVSKL